METEEKVLTMEEMFCGMPKLLEFFENIDDSIKTFRRMKTNSFLTKEILIQRKDVLLKTAKELEERDLKIIYYLKNLSGINMLCLHRMLVKMKKAECDFKNSLQKETVYFDIFNPLSK